MPVKHLTEKEMQDYIDNPAGNRFSEIKNHLDSCEQCSYQYSAYMHIIEGCMIESEDIFTEKFEDTIIRKISRPQIEIIPEKKWMFLTIPAAVFLCMLISYFIFPLIFPFLERFLYTTLQVAGQPVFYLISALDVADIGVEHLTVIGVFVLIFSYLDRILFSKYQMN